MPRLDDPARDGHGPDASARYDLRLPLLGAAAWSGGLLGHLVGWSLRTGRPGPAVTVLAVAVVLGAVLLLRLRGARVTAAAALVVLVTVTVGASLRALQTGGSPVAELAGERAVVTVEGQIASDPRRVESAYGRRVMLTLRVDQVTGRGSSHRLRTRVLVLAGHDAGWSDVPLGARVRAQGRLAPAEDDVALAGLLTARGSPERLAPPDLWWRGAAAVRAAIRASVAGRPDEQAALVPALVDGDDAGVTGELAEAFRTTGLTHLLAVSGTNLTLVVGFLLVIARWCRVRGRGLLFVGAAGIVGFVLLARTEPSVVRAAAMGAVGLLAMSSNGRQRALRGLGAAVLVLLLLEPGLAVTAGFALSVLATAGILLVGPSWRDALARWLPRWLAEAIAVPAAAQLACTPVVAALSGQVSIVAVAANLLVQPVVGPATVLGLVGGLITLLWPLLGSVLGACAGWCVAWIIAVAHRGAALPGADLTWGSGPLALLLLTVLVVAVALLGPRVLRHRWPGLAVALVMVVVVGARPPALGWPADGWVLAACDVGQGDAMAVRVGPRSAVVVDAGPEPAPLRDCLSDLGVREVPLVVLTHFHADHVDGLAGVTESLPVGEVLVSPVADPAEGAAQVAEVAGAAGVPVTPATYAEARRVGEASLQVVWPLPTVAGGGAVTAERDGEGSAANDASVVLIVETGGLRLLLTGDVEPPAQAALARILPGLTVDVLKVPHHGSRHQDADWLASLDADLALVSAGADNDYGHPAPATVDLLRRTGTSVHSTHLDGTLLVVAGPVGPTVVSR